MTRTIIIFLLIMISIAVGYMSVNDQLTEPAVNCTIDDIVDQ